MVASTLFLSLITVNVVFLELIFAAYMNYHNHVTTPIDGDVILNPNDRIYHSESDHASRDTELAFGLDGNFVLKDKTVNTTIETGVLWATNTKNTNAHVLIKHTGNIAIQINAGKILWESGTSGHSDTQPHQLFVDYRCAYLMNKDFTVLWFIGDPCVMYGTSSPSAPVTTDPPSDVQSNIPSVSPIHFPAHISSYGPLSKVPTEYPISEPFSSLLINASTTTRTDDAVHDVQTSDIRVTNNESINVRKKPTSIGHDSILIIASVSVLICGALTVCYFGNKKKQKVLEEMVEKNGNAENVEEQDGEEKEQNDIGDADKGAMDSVPVSDNKVELLITDNVLQQIKKDDDVSMDSNLSMYDNEGRHEVNETLTLGGTKVGLDDFYGDDCKMIREVLMQCDINDWEVYLNIFIDNEMTDKLLLGLVKDNKYWNVFLPKVGPRLKFQNAWFKLFENVISGVCTSCGHVGYGKVNEGDGLLYCKSCCVSYTATIE